MSLPGFTAEAALYRTSKHYHMAGDYYTAVGNQQILPQVCVHECTSFFDDFTFGGPVHKECELFCTTDPEVFCGPCNARGMQRCVVPHYGAAYVPC